MSKKTYRIYKAGGAQDGKVLNPTAQFLARAEEGMQQPSQDEMQMMQQQQQKLMQLINAYSQEIQASPEDVMQQLQESEPEEQQILIQEMQQVVQQGEMPAQEQPMGKGGYVKKRLKELKKAKKGIQQEDSSVPTINDIPNGREAFVSDFTDAVKNSADDALLKKQAEDEYENISAGENLPMERYGRGRARRQEKQGDRRAVRQIDRESDMYSRPDRRLLRRGLRNDDFTREEMLRGDNVLGKAGAPYMAPPGSTPIQSEEELLYTPEQVFDMLPYNTATPQEKVLTEKTTERIEEGVIQPNGDPYEYKNEDGVLYTRKKGSDKWIKVDPESKAGKEIREKVYDEEGVSPSEKEFKSPPLKQIEDLQNEIGLPTVTDMINKNAADAFTFTGVPSADDGNASFEDIQALYASMGKQDPTQRGPSSPENLAKPSGRLDMLDKDWIMNTALAPAFATSLIPKWAPTGSSVPSVISSGARTAIPKGQTVLNAGQKVLGQGQKLIEAPGGAQFSLFEEGGEMDLPEARFGREQRMLNRFLRRQNRRTPAGFGMNQFGIPSSGLNMITPAVAGSEGSQGTFPGDFHMSTKYGLFGRPRRVDIDYTGNMPFNLMSPLMTGFFGQGFPTNTAYGGRYQSGIRYEDPISTAAKVINKDQTTTDAEEQTEERNQNDGKSKGSSKKSEPGLPPNEFIRRDGIRGAFADEPNFGVYPDVGYTAGLPSAWEIINKNANKATTEKPSYIVDKSRPINPNDLVVGQPAINPLLMPTGFGTAAAQGVTGLTKLLGSGSAAPKALGAGQKLLEAPGGTQFTLFQPGGFVDPNDAAYGNPDLYKFISGGMDQADIDYMNSKDVTDPYMAQDGLEVYQDKGEVKDTFDPRYASPVNQRFNNYDPYGNFMGGRSMYPSDPRMQYRPQQGFPMPGVGYPGGYGRQQYPTQTANSMGMLAGSAFGNTYGFRGAGQPKIFNRAGSYWTQTGFPGQPVNMNNLTSAKFKGRQGLLGPRGKAEFTFNGASGDGKQSTDPLITLDKNKGSMIDGPAKQAEQSDYMTNRQFARDQMQNDPSMSGRDKRELRRQLNKGQTTQLEYLDRQADVESMMNEANPAAMPSGSNQINTKQVSEPTQFMDGSGQMLKQGPGLQSMPVRPADQIQTDGSEPTGPAAGSPQDISGSPEINPTYSFGQPQTFGSASGYGTPSVSSGSTAPSESSGEPNYQQMDSYWDNYHKNQPSNSNVVQPSQPTGTKYYGVNKEFTDAVGMAYGGEYEEGGEYDLTEAEIGLIMAAGGMVEYV